MSVESVINEERRRAAFRLTLAGEVIPPVAEGVEAVVPGGEDDPFAWYNNPDDVDTLADFLATTARNMVKRAAERGRPRPYGVELLWSA